MVSAGCYRGRWLGKKRYIPLLFPFSSRHLPGECFPYGCPLFRPSVRSLLWIGADADGNQNRKPHTRMNEYKQRKLTEACGESVPMTVTLPREVAGRLARLCGILNLSSQMQEVAVGIIKSELDSLDDQPDLACMIAEQVEYPTAVEARIGSLAALWLITHGGRTQMNDRYGTVVVSHQGGQLELFANDVAWETVPNPTLRDQN